LQVRRERVPQVGDDALPHPVAQVLGREVEEAAPEREHHDADDGERQGVQVLLGEDLVEGVLREEGMLLSMPLNASMQMTARTPRGQRYGRR
jgi:hypothetical protein